MPSFLDFSITSKTARKIVWKHFQFSILWILNILVVFRLDLATLSSLGISIAELELIVPFAMLLMTTLVILRQKWYYTLAFFLYPILVIGWFIPKFILRRGKIYLFTNYVNSIYNRLKNIRVTLFHIFIFTLSLVLLALTSSIFSRYFAILIFSYLYLHYAVNYIQASFKPAKLFGVNVENYIKSLIIKAKKGRSEFLNSYAKPSAKEDKLSVEQRQQEQALRLALLDFTIEYANSQLNGFKGKRAFVISIVFGVGMFLFFSIIFFWFLNFQLYLIDPNHYMVIRDATQFDFLYYTIKTITFSDIDFIKPSSNVAKWLEMISFFALGIIILVVLMSIIFALKQEKINENLKLTKELCSLENERIREYAKTELNIDIQEAAHEIGKIKNSVEALRKILEKIF